MSRRMPRSLYGTPQWSSHSRPRASRGGAGGWIGDWGSLTARGCRAGARSLERLSRILIAEGRHHGFRGEGRPGRPDPPAPLAPNPIYSKISVRTRRRTPTTRPPQIRPRRVTLASPVIPGRQRSLRRESPREPRPRRSPASPTPRSRPGRERPAVGVEDQPHRLARPYQGSPGASERDADLERVGLAQLQQPLAPAQPSGRSAPRGGR